MKAKFYTILCGNVEKIIHLNADTLDNQLKKEGINEVDFIKIDSYWDGTKSSGTVRLLKDISAYITDRDVIVVEGIVDTGLSLKFLKHPINDLRVFKDRAL